MGMTTLTSIRISKLDGRHTGNNWFTHRVTFIGHRQGCTNSLSKAREWLWVTFGPSREIQTFGFTDPNSRPLWAWETDSTYSCFRIYLTGQALTQFLLIKEQFA